MGSGRKQGGMRRRGWLHRAGHHGAEQSAEAAAQQSAEATGEAPAEAGGEEQGPGGIASEGGVRGGGSSGEPTGPDTQASLDEVLRQAAERRDAGGGPAG